jgi:anti-sigma regulatory factor (Ser/Thr protein kinase)
VGVVIQLQLDPTDAAPTLAREAVDRLEGELPGDMLDDLRLVVSELVTNAVTHGPRSQPVDVRLRVTGPGTLEGEVADQGDHGVIEIRESAGEGGGWGLKLVDRIAVRWGVRHGSTHVWFEMRAEGAA